MLRDDETITLVNSLTGAEVRFFKLFSKVTGGDKKFVELFDVFRGVETLTEAEQIVEQKKDLVQVLANRKYLFQMILKALRVFHSNKLNEMNQSFLDMEVLMRKGMFNSAKKLILKMQEMSLETGDSSSFITLLLREIGIRFLMKDEDFFEAYGEKELKMHLAAAKAQHDFYNLMFKVHYMDSIGRKLNFGPNPGLISKLTAIENDKELNDMQPKPSDNLFLFWSNYKAAIATYLFKADDAINYTKKSLATFELQPIIKTHMPRNMVQLLFLQQRRKELKQTVKESLDDLEKLNVKLKEHTSKPLSDDFQLYITSEYITRKTTHLGMLAEPMNSPITFLKIHEDFLKFNRTLLGVHYFKWLDYSCALYECLNERPDSAYDYLLKVFDKETKLYRKLQLKSEMLEAMILLDQKSIKVLSNRIRALDRLYKIQDPHLESAKVMIRFFRTMAGKRFKPEIEKENIVMALQQLKEAQNKYAGEKLFQRKLGLEIWLNNRLKKIQS